MLQLASRRNVRGRCWSVRSTGSPCRRGRWTVETSVADAGRQRVFDVSESWIATRRALVENAEPFISRHAGATYRARATEVLGPASGQRSTGVLRSIVAAREFDEDRGKHPRRARRAFTRHDRVTADFRVRASGQTACIGNRTSSPATAFRSNTSSAWPCASRAIVACTAESCLASSRSSRVCSSIRVFGVSPSAAPPRSPPPPPSRRRPGRTPCSRRRAPSTSPVQMKNDVVALSGCVAARHRDDALHVLRVVELRRQVVHQLLLLLGQRRRRGSSSAPV